jgi:hypothetical protein
MSCTAASILCWLRPCNTTCKDVPIYKSRGHLVRRKRHLTTAFGQLVYFFSKSLLRVHGLFLRSVQAKRNAFLENTYPNTHMHLPARSRAW